MDWEAAATIVSALIIAIVGPIVYYHYKRMQGQKKLEGQVLLKYGNVVAIRTCDGTYVQPNEDNNLVAGVPHVREWEIYEIAEAAAPFSYVTNRSVQFGDRIALKAKKHGKFVGADLSSRNELRAWVAHVQSWETFELSSPHGRQYGRKNRTVRYGDVFALRAHNGRYVMYNRDGDRSLSAVSSHIQSWEEFIFVLPSQPK
jgi:hypothetical protein